MGYYFNSGIFNALLEHLPDNICSLLTEQVEKWEKETGRQQLISSMPSYMTALIPSDHFDKEPGIGFWLCRMGSTQLDFDKLLKIGIPGLLEQIHAAHAAASAPDSLQLYEGMELFLLSFQEILFIAVI